MTTKRMNDSLMAEHTRTEDAARLIQKCKNCKHFYRLPGGIGDCRYLGLRPNISAEGTCGAWAPRPAWMRKSRSDSP